MERTRANLERAAKRSWKSRAAIALGCLLLTIAGAAAFINSGIYSVTATDGHSTGVEWLLRTTMERSVRRQAAEIVVPPGIDLRDRAYATKFFGHYNAACVTCHSAPGVAKDPWTVNYPPAPDLTDAKVVSRWSDTELHWIIKHGIRDTAMIALGPTHKDADIWGVTALVRQLPGLTADDYQAMARAYEATKHGQATDMSAPGASADKPDVGESAHEHHH
jgi:hypothetical protein